jgi:hypothetical protein
LEEQSHVLPPPSIKSSYRLVDIVLLMDGICTLVNVIIVDPTRINFVSWVDISHGVLATIAAQMKEGIYCNCYPANMFFPLAIEVFGCFHQQSDNLFINVPTWHEQQKAPNTLFYWFCVLFIDR